DVLVVGVDSDRGIKLYKNELRPVIPQEERMEMLKETEPKATATIRAYEDVLCDFIAEHDIEYEKNKIKALHTLRDLLVDFFVKNGQALVDAGSTDFITPQIRSINNEIADIRTTIEFWEKQ
ncbi:MAG: hypothetical protein NTU73_10015, partial [Ignavibacteriae bacterium]|nr:hypothetical protein [Ignavibacteriota bacterium]